jgi:ABC-type transport system involved in multi-copper enzyme maturation permease subunit
MYALWLETRTGFWLMAGLVPALVVLGLSTATLDAAQCRRLLEGPLFVTFGLAATVFSNGVAAGPGSRPSLLYTLSLPVARRELLLGRALVGLAQGAALVMGGSALVWSLVPELRAHVSASGMLRYALLVLGGQALFCGVRVLLSTRMEPAWSLAATIVLFAATVIARINAGLLPEGHGARAAFDLLVPLLALRPGASLAFCALTAAAAISVALARFERSDF